LTTYRVALPKPHQAQRQIIDTAPRFAVVCCGRRWGKSVLGLDRLAHTALTGGRAAYFAPTYKLLAEAWRDVGHILAPVTASRNVQEHRLELVTGGMVEMWSLDGPDPARGRKYHRVVLDEAAMVPALLDIWQLAIRPTLADYRGDAWFLSTPKGLNGFHTLYQQGRDPQQPEWCAWQMPTTSNPYIDPAEVQAAQQELPERAFAQEFRAQFLVDGAGVFRGVQAAAILQPQPPLRGHQYAIGVDWGKYNDFTVLSVLDTTVGHQVHLERFNQIDYTLQMGRLQELAGQYRPQVIVAERNSMGDPLIEQAQRLGLPIQPWTATNASKADAINALSLALERQSLLLLDDPVQTAELLAFDAERLPSGMLRYAAPNGGHDDCVMSLAMAWQAAAHPTPAPLTLRFGG
jgi:hypothetical protein